MKSLEKYVLQANVSQAVEADVDQTQQCVAVKPKSARPRSHRMPPWNVLLHNDEVNDMGFVVESIIELTTLRPQIALVKMLEAHKTGAALLLSTHREHAELLQEQFASKGLTVTIEPDR